MLGRAVPPIAEQPIGAGEYDEAKREASRRVRDALQRVQVIERERELLGRTGSRHRPRPESGR